MRTILLLLLVLVFVHALCCSLLILTGFQEFLPSSWLQNMLKEIPQENDVRKALWYTVAVGGMHLIPIHLNFKKHAARFRWAIASSLMLLILICAEVLILRYQIRYQLLLAIEAACTLLLAYTLEKDEEETSSGAIIIKMKSQKRKSEYPAPYNPIS